MRRIVTRPARSIASSPCSRSRRRWYVGWQFFGSGWLELRSWDGTLYLFENGAESATLNRRR
jgi:hypothetical protein